MAAEWDNLITDSNGMRINGSFSDNNASGEPSENRTRMQSEREQNLRKANLSSASSEQSLLSEDQEEYVVTEYIMEYTDIFEPSQQKLGFIDIHDGDAISEASDEEVVAHSTEHEKYADVPKEIQDREESGDDAACIAEDEIRNTPAKNRDMGDNGVTEGKDRDIVEGKESQIVEEEVEIKDVDERLRKSYESNNEVDIESQDELSLETESEGEKGTKTQLDNEERYSNDEERVKIKDDNEVEKRVEIADVDDVEKRIEIEDEDDEDATTEVDKLINKKQDNIKKSYDQASIGTQFEEQPLLTSFNSTSPEPYPSTPPTQTKFTSPGTKTYASSTRTKAISPSKTSSQTTQSRKQFSSKAYPGKVVKTVRSTNDQDVSNSSRTTNLSAQQNAATVRKGKSVQINDGAKTNKTGTAKYQKRQIREDNGTKSHVRGRTEQSSDANFFRARLPQTSKRHPKRHVWLCRDSEIHRLIAEKAAILRRYKEEGITGHNRSKQKGFPNYSEVDVLGLPSVGFSGKIKDDSHRSSLPYSKHPSSRSSQSYRSHGASSSEDEDERTNRLGVKKPSGTFAVGLAARRNLTKQQQQEEHEKDQHLSDDDGNGCELCAAEAREKEKHEKKLQELEAAAKAGPHHPRNLMLGIVYAAKFLGSTKLMSPSAPNKAVRLQQAQEAISRIKVPEGEEQPSSNVDLFISTERIKVVSAEHKQTLLDHHLKTISFIADIGNIIVVMARLSSEEEIKTWSGKMPDFKMQNTEKTSKVVCHVLETNEAQTIAKTVGQAFSIAYHEFLKVNQLSLDEIEDAEYNGILEQQKILGEELSLLADESKAKEVVIHKKYGESLSMMIVESGWGSMIPTVVIAHLDNKGPAAKSGQLNVGNQILAVNGQSLVGLPLVDCQNIIRAMKYEERVALKVVCCPPTVEICVNRPDTKYQLGFSVQNGMICSLMRGGIAERGGVRVGHKIIELNGESVVTATHHYIVNILQTKIGELRMKTMPITLYKLLVGLEIPQYL